MSTTSVDRLAGVSSSKAIKVACDYTTTANISLSGLATQAGGTWGSALTQDDNNPTRILVKNQTNAIDNGIWNPGAGTWTRAKDFDGARDVGRGTVVHVYQLDGDLWFEVSTANPIVIGTSSISFVASTAASILARLADSTSASNGPGIIGFGPALNYVAGTIGAVIMDNFVNVFWFMTEAERQDVKTGAGLIDVGPKLDAATEYAAAGNRSVYMPNGMYKRTTAWAVPTKVGIRGESRGRPSPIYDPANAYGYGVVLFKAHTGHGITRTGGVVYESCEPTYNVAISSHRTTYAGGNGFVADNVSECNYYECEVWGVAGDAFVIGTTAGDVTGQNLLQDCYVNNCGGKAYNIRAKWQRGRGNKSDGCTHGAYFDNAPETDWANSHHEGWTQIGIQFAQACTSSKLTGKTFIGNTAGGTCGVKLDSVAGNSDITLDNVKIQAGSVVGALTFTGALVAATSGTLTAGFGGTTGSYEIYFSSFDHRTATLTNGSTAVSWTGAVTATANINYISNPTFVGVEVGAAAINTKIHRCEINQAPVGVNDNGSVGTQVVSCHITQNGVCINANTGQSRYETNSFDTTQGVDIDHIGANTGIWVRNQFSKGIKPTSSGAAGNFGTNLVKDNKGWRTESGGTTGGVIASGASIAHGLSGSAIPLRFVGTPTSPATYTNFRLGTADATNIQFLWDGGGTFQVQWSASAVCALQS